MDHYYYIIDNKVNVLQFLTNLSVTDTFNSEAHSTGIWDSLQNDRPPMLAKMLATPYAGGTGTAQPYANWFRAYQGGTSSPQVPAQKERSQEHCLTPVLSLPLLSRGTPSPLVSPGRCFSRPSFYFHLVTSQIKLLCLQPNPSFLLFILSWGKNPQGFFL